MGLFGKSKSKERKAVERELGQLVDIAYRERVVQRSVLIETIGRFVVPSVVSAIMFTDDFAPYADFWKAPPNVGYDLACFLANLLAFRAVPPDSPRSASLMQGIGAIYKPSERASAAINRYFRLLSDPQELRDRRVGMVHAGSPDAEAASFVFPMVVNELLSGPSLELENELGMPPDQTLQLYAWLNDMYAETVARLRDMVRDMGPLA